MTMKLQTYPNREAWLAARKGFVGASDISTLFGAGYKTRLELWLDKTGKLPEEETPLRLKVGSALEPEVFELAKELVPEPIRYLGWFPHHLKTTLHPRLAVTLDAAGYDPETEADLQILSADDVTMTVRDGAAPVELKTISTRAEDGWPEDQPHAHAALQTAALQVVLCAPVGYIVGMVGLGEGRRYYPREAPPQSFVDAMLSEIDAFWGYVERDEPPPPDPRDGKALSLLYPKDTGRAILLPSGMATLAERRKALAEQIGTLSKAKDELDNEVKALLGDASVGIPEGSTIAFRWKEETRQVAYTSTYRRFQVGTARKQEVAALEGGEP